MIDVDFVLDGSLLQVRKIPAKELFDLYSLERVLWVAGRKVLIVRCTYTAIEQHIRAEVVVKGIA